MGPYNHNTERRKWEQLKEKERYEIEALVRAGHTPREIAKQLGRDRRTIEREIKRGSVVHRRENPKWSRNPEVKEYLDEMVYAADVGQRKAERNAANKGRGLKVGRDHKLVRHLERRIGQEGYSPDAAIGEIKGKGMQFQVSLCTKTVYNMIDRGDFLNLTNRDLPVKKEGKKRRYRKTRAVALNNLQGRSIEERPEAATERIESGHWEMDLVVGKGKACLLVLTERKSRKEMLFKLPEKRQQSVIAVLNRLEKRYRGRFKERFQSITMDNGSEFLDFDGLETSIRNPGEKRTVCYYAHPYSAWERGSNENANKLIRRFVPKGSNIDKLSTADVKRIERWMNNYPRKLFGYKTANDMYETA